MIIFFLLDILISNGTMYAPNLFLIEFSNLKKNQIFNVLTIGFIFDFIIYQTYVVFTFGLILLFFINRFILKKIKNASLKLFLNACLWIGYLMIISQKNILFLWNKTTLLSFFLLFMTRYLWSKMKKTS